MRPFRLVIVERRTLFRQGLAALLREENDFLVAGEAADAQEARLVCRRTQPDVILLDAALSEMPDSDGLAVLASLRACCPQAAILVLGKAGDTASETGAAQERRHALECGAAAYLCPSIDHTELTRTLRTAVAALAGDESCRFASSREEREGDFRGQNAAPAFRKSITEREGMVLALIAQGLCNKEIAYRLNISAQTAKNHVSRLLEKLDFADRTQLAVYALEHHLTE